MTVRENIEQMIGALAQNDKETANSMFQAVISQKVADRLDSYKVDIADQYFNGFKEGAHEMDGE